MSTHYTANAKLAYPDVADRNWGPLIAGDLQALDALAPIGGLCVTVAEVPSATLNVTIATGQYRSSTGSVVTFAGLSSYGLSASSTVFLWMDDAGTLHSGSGFPASAPYTPLAVVVTGTATIASVQDARVMAGAVGYRAEPTGTVTATYAVLTADGLVRCDATSGAFTATLPAPASVPGKVYRLIKIDASTNAVAVATASGTINGASTLSLASQWAGKTFVSDGANWNGF